jgi:hypothetical protein
MDPKLVHPSLHMSARYHNRAPKVRTFQSNRQPVIAVKNYDQGGVPIGLAKRIDFAFVAILDD